MPAFNICFRASLLQNVRAASVFLGEKNVDRVSDQGFKIVLRAITSLAAYPQRQLATFSRIGYLVEEVRYGCIFIFFGRNLIQFKELPI